MDSTQVDASAQEPFRSTLQNAAECFLAHAIEHALRHGRRSAKDFIRHFPPATIMAGLEDEPQLRANILVTATGVRMKVALKKSATSCGNDLQIALDERETDADTVVGLFGADDRVRFLDSRALWTFLIEGEFWQADAKKDAKTHAVAATHIAYLIERGLEDQLLTHRDVVRGITVQSMTNLLPRSELPKIIDAALELGQAKKPFLDKNLLDGISIATLTKHIPLSAIWAQVVVPYIAEAHGLAPVQEQAPPPPVEKPRAAPPEPPARPRPVEAPVASPSASGLFSPARPSATPAAPAKAAATPVDDRGLDLAVDDLLDSLTSGQAPAKVPQRRPGSVPPTA